MSHCNNYETEGLFTYNNNFKRGFIFTGSKKFTVNELEVFELVMV